MEASMKENGKTVKLTAKVISGMQMEMFMKDNGKRTKRTATVFMYM
jgi:hypothetical protein